MNVSFWLFTPSFSIAITAYNNNTLSLKSSSILGLRPNIGHKEYYSPKAVPHNLWKITMLGKNRFPACNLRKFRVRLRCVMNENERWSKSISQMAYNLSISMQHEMGLSRKHSPNHKTTRIYQPRKWKIFRFLVLDRAGRTGGTVARKFLAWLPIRPQKNSMIELLVPLKI